MTPEQLIALKAKAREREAAANMPSTISDVAQSIPQYGENIAASTLGYAGDIAKGIGMGVEKLGQGGEWIADRTIGPGQFEGPKPDYSKAIGSEDVQAKFNEWQGGPLYQPQTPIGQGIGTTTKLLPLVLGGPGSLAAKTLTRAALPAAGIEAIKASPLPEGAKPWAEGAVVMLSPFAANKAVGSTLNMLKRDALMRSTGKLPNDIDALIPSKISGGTLPTKKQIESTRDALDKIAKMAPKGPQRDQARVAADEMNRRLEAMKIVDRYVKEKSVTYNNAQRVKDQLGELNAAVKAGSHPGVFTPEQVAQLEKAAQGSLPARLVERASNLSPTDLKKGGVSGVVLAHLASWVDPEVSKMVVAGVPWAVGLAAKAAYPGMNSRQINKFIASIKRGRDVPGAPQFTPRPVTPPSYSPLTPGAAINPFVDEEQ